MECAARAFRDEPHQPQEAYQLDGACTNRAEEFFSRMRRAEIGHHHHIAGAYLLRYAQEAAWREDNRRMSNGEQVNRACGSGVGARRRVDFTGYWQRHRGVFSLWCFTLSSRLRHCNRPRNFRYLPTRGIYEHSNNSQLHFGGNRSGSIATGFVQELFNE